MLSGQPTRACLSKRADTPTDAGAANNLDATSAGSAVVSINAEDKLSVSISDGSGRGVMSAQIEPYDGARTPAPLIRTVINERPDTCRF